MKCRFQMASAPLTELRSDWGIIRHLWVHITSSFVSISVWVQWGSRKSNQSDNGAHYAQTSSVVVPFEVLPQNRHCVGLSDTLICVTETCFFTVSLLYFLLLCNGYIWKDKVNVWLCDKQHRYVQTYNQACVETWRSTKSQRVVFIKKSLAL